MEQAELALRHCPLNDCSIRHNQRTMGGRTRDIVHIYIESETEKDPISTKHPNGARAMARHVAEGGIHDDFGKHIIIFPEELSR